MELDKSGNGGRILWEKPGGWDLGEEGRWRNGSGWGRTVLGGSNNAIASKKFATPTIPVLRAQFANHAIPKYPHLLGTLAFKVFN
jgi:hypothetical protein